MAYRLLADLVVVLHAVFALFTVLGGLLALRWRRFILVHLPCALWGASIEISGGVCPLTPLENWLRTESGGRGYAGGFIEHYLLPALYPARNIQYLLAGLVVAVNLAVSSRSVHPGFRGGCRVFIMSAAPEDRAPPE